MNYVLHLIIDRFYQRAYMHSLSLKTKWELVDTLHLNYI